MAAKRHNQNTQEKAAPARADDAAKYKAHVPAEIRNVSFPVAVRGYDRDAVETYVRRVNRVIAELEVTRSPQAAVRHAVERVGEQTKQILEEARESAEKITTTAQAEADEIVAQAKAKAADLAVAASTDADRIRAESEELVASSKAQAETIVANAKAQAEGRRRQADKELAELQAQAEARRTEVETDTAKVWDRRRELLGDIDRMAAELHEAASEAAARLSQESPEPPSEAQTAVIAPSTTGE
jgi:DivIVA domain-containing protein